MSNELLDFKKQDNFEFLKFSPWAKKVYGEERLNKFKNNCGNVLEKAQKTVFDLCLLGQELKTLKAGGEWKEVLDRKDNYKFEYKSFEAFCAYTFGFSQTRTSDLLRIAQFIDTKSKEPKFIEEKYSEYNTSQLIELAAVKDYDWKYFNPKMTVAEMRRAKKYMLQGSFYVEKNNRDFDLMTYTEAWEAEQEEKKKKKPDVQPNGVLPGQIGLTEEVFEPIAEDELPKNPTSDFASACGEEDYIEAARQKAHEAGIPFYEGDADEFDPYVYDGKMSVEDYKLMHQLREEAEEEEVETLEPDYVDEVNEIENDCEEIENETPEIENNKYNFATRTGVREFLHNYMNWERMIGFIGCFFNGLYRYRFKNGISLIAATGVMVTGNGEELSSQSKVKMYIWENESEKAKEITQNQLEKYIAAHLSEL